MEAANLQGIVTRFLSREQRLSPRQWQVCSHIQTCRTAALGGLRRQCDRCDYAIPQYHACRDRHCPQCQWRASRRWCEKQQAAVLPITYYHLVFTLPHTLNRWAQLHPRVIYALLFRCVWATLKRFAAESKTLGGELGMSAVLHTWGQNLSQHIHLHCLLPGGTLAADGHGHRPKAITCFRCGPCHACCGARWSAPCAQRHKTVNYGALPGPAISTTPSIP